MPNRITFSGMPQDPTDQRTKGIQCHDETDADWCGAICRYGTEWYYVILEEDCELSVFLDADQVRTIADKMDELNKTIAEHAAKEQEQSDG